MENKEDSIQDVVRRKVWDELTDLRSVDKRRYRKKVLPHLIYLALWGFVIGTKVWDLLLQRSDLLWNIVILVLAVVLLLGEVYILHDIINQLEQNSWSRALLFQDYQWSTAYREAQHRKDSENVFYKDFVLPRTLYLNESLKESGMMPKENQND